jgi:Tfp pilus assembly PilM family ATPase
VALGRTRGKELTVEQAFAIPLGTREEGSWSEDQIAEKIGEALRRRGVGRADALVAIGRANIELRQLSVPPAPPDELPEMVRFQALRQFTTIGEDWPLDFVQLAGGEAGSINVLAAAISPEVVRQIRATCEKSNLAPHRIVLRPFAAASLLRRHDRGAKQPCRLMVDLLMEEADLSVMDDDYMLLTRTVRLTSTEDRETQARGLLGEIRRTIAAANNQLGGRRVEKVILCGSGTEHAAIKRLVEQELTLPVDLFEPFDEMRLGPELADRRPEKSGQFAPLLGLLMDEATGSPHTIDFLHPRREPESKNTPRRKVLIAATLAAMLLAAIGWVWFELWSLDSEIVQLAAQKESVKKEVKTAQDRLDEAKMVQTFLDHNVNYLDELEWLSERLPPADDVIVTKVSFTSPVAPSGAQLDVEGYMRESDQFAEIEARLRESGRIVKSGSSKTDDLKRDRYKYTWKESVKIPVGKSAEPAKGSVAGKTQLAKANNAGRTAQESSAAPGKADEKATAEKATAEKATAERTTDEQKSGDEDAKRVKKADTAEAGGQDKSTESAPAQKGPSP